MLTEFIKANTPNIMVSQDALEKIAEHFEERTFAKNDFLLKGGRNSGYFYLADGFMRAFTFDTEGREVTTYFYPKDRVVFENVTFYVKEVPIFWWPYLYQSPSAYATRVMAPRR